MSTITDSSVQITSLVSLGKGYFATASNVAENQAGNIKIWDPNQASPITTITEESCAIDFLVPILAAYALPIDAVVCDADRWSTFAVGVFHLEVRRIV